MLYRLLLLHILWCATITSSTLSTRYVANSSMIINKPVVDLRSSPEAPLSHVQLPTSDLTNPQQETQLLLGEHVLVQQEFIDAFGTKWLYVYVPQQDHFSFMLGWHQYRGWIQADAATPVPSFQPATIVAKTLLTPIHDIGGQTVMTVSIGTRFNGTYDADRNEWRVVLPTNQIGYIADADIYSMAPHIQESCLELRSAIVATALKFKDSWYSWGGRSAQSDQWQISSVDCSALINLSFLANGLAIPRMSNDQYLTASKIVNGSDLQPGDLVLFDPVHKDRNPHHMTHVMMYVADNLLLEATFAQEHKVRLVSFEERIGKLPADTISGDITQTTMTGIDVDDTEYFVYFCSYLGSMNTLQKLRDNAVLPTWKPLQLTL